jgi:hypothetical protein
MPFPMKPTNPADMKNIGATKGKVAKKFIKKKKGGIPAGFSKFQASKKAETQGQSSIKDKAVNRLKQLSQGA